MNLFTHIYNIKSTITILYLFSICGGGIKQKKERLNKLMPREKSWTLKMKMYKTMVSLIFIQKSISSNLLVSTRKSMIAFCVLVLLEISKNFFPWKRTPTIWEPPSSKIHGDLE